VSRAKHIAIRSCLGCGKRDAKTAMLRIVRTSAGPLAVDAEGRRPGRGGYLHRLDDCWRSFAQRKGMLRSLRVSVERDARAVLVERLREGVLQ
jgi:predicted RNA-binding protein YlxR (DUF448 family)